MSSVFVVTLGRKGHSPGHCHNCAQLQLTLTVRAKDKKEAVAKVKAAAKLHRTGEGNGVFLQLAGAGLFGRLTMDPDLIEIRTVKVKQQAKDAAEEAA